MDTFNSCRGPCAQGRKLCPCPSACQRMESDDGLAAAKGILWGFILSLAAWFVIIAFLVAALV